MLQAKDLLNFGIPKLDGLDTVAHALDLFDEFKVYYLPLVDGQKLIQMLSNDVLFHYDESILLKNVAIGFDDLAIFDTQTIFEATKQIMDSNHDVFPVIDFEQNYLGCILKLDVYQHLIEGLQLQAMGGIIEVKTKQKDYPFYDIARLVEQENAHLLSMVYYDDKKNTPSLILKINSDQISYLVLSLERNGYEVISYFSTEKVISIEKDRFDNLMRYLSI